MSPRAHLPETPNRQLLAAHNPWTARRNTTCWFPETCFSQNFTQNSGAALRDQRRNSRRFEPLPTTLRGRPPSWALLHLSHQHFQMKSLT